MTTTPLDRREAYVEQHGEALTLAYMFEYKSRQTGPFSEELPDGCPGFGNFQYNDVCIYCPSTLDCIAISLCLKVTSLVPIRRGAPRRKAPRYEAFEQTVLEWCARKRVPFRVYMDVGALQTVKMWRAKHGNVGVREDNLITPAEVRAALK